jgi:uncharacterized protein (DUF4415 family)
MTVNRPWTDPDDAPDLSSPEYHAKFAAVPCRRKAKTPTKVPKVHVGFRLAADVVESVKASGRGYNRRVEQALRKAGFGRHKASEEEGRRQALRASETTHEA